MRGENREELIDKEVDVLRDAHAALSKSIAAVAAAREKVAAVEAALGAADSAGAAKGGVPYKELLDTLKWRGIQVYWNGTMVGHDIRKFLASFEEILARIAAKIASIQRTEKAEGVLQRHTSCLRPLNVISHLTRKAELLTAWPAAFQADYPDHIILTPKGIVIEEPHAFCAKIWSLGIFGEDGAEALHPMEAKARLIARSVKNAVRRHKAILGHLAVKQNF